MFNENNKTQEQEIVLPEKTFDNGEPEINDTAKIAEEDNGAVVSEKQNEKEEEKTAPAQEPEDVAEARSRALAQVERLSREKGFSGPWGNLFRAYPSLSRKDAIRELGDVVKSGMSPLEAYQQKLLAEKEQELKTLRSSATATKRSIGAVAEENTEQQLDDFLIGFYSV